MRGAARRVRSRPSSRTTAPFRHRNSSSGCWTSDPSRRTSAVDGAARTARRLRSDRLSSWRHRLSPSCPGRTMGNCRPVRAHMTPRAAHRVRRVASTHGGARVMRLSCACRREWMQTRSVSAAANNAGRSTQSAGAVARERGGRRGVRRRAGRAPRSASATIRAMSSATVGSSSIVPDDLAGGQHADVGPAVDQGRLGHHRGVGRHHHLGPRQLVALLHGRALLGQGGQRGVGLAAEGVGVGQRPGQRPEPAATSRGGRPARCG